jgi:hypothetical protein
MYQRMSLVNRLESPETRTSQAVVRFEDRALALTYNHYLKRRLAALRRERPTATAWFVNHLNANRVPIVAT